MRRRFLALVDTRRTDEGRARGRRLGEILEQSGWRAAATEPGFAIYVASPSAFPVRRLGAAGWVIGDVFGTDAAGHEPDRPENVSPQGAARGLSRRCWGQYVALLRSPTGDEAAVFRDPSGMVDCLAWSLQDGLEVVASDIAGVPGPLRPRRLSLNWDRIGAFVSVTTAATTASLFDDVAAVGPGELLSLPPARRSPEVIWSPIPFAASAAEDVGPIGEAIVARVDRCTAALVGSHKRVLVELSGGLDSSALAGTIDAVGLRGRVAQWMNITDARPEGDESAYAKDVTDRLGAVLTTIPRTPGVVREEDLSELAGETWPALAGVDAARDRDAVGRLRATGATGIVSGQGGDAAFFQMGTPLVVADQLERQGLAALGSEVLPNVARRTRHSVWRVLSDARAARRGRLPERKVVSQLVSPDLLAQAADVEHAWVRAAFEARLPPGKRLHVRAIATNHFHHQYSRRRREADLLYPFLAQPVVELCLGVPTWQLAGGAYDRPYQRALFRDRIPPSVLRRRAKGNLSVYFARLMANSLGMLKPYLLEGRLCAAGVLHRPTLERVLDPQHLIWRDAASDLVGALAVEAWVQSWQTRVPDSPDAPRR